MKRAAWMLAVFAALVALLAIGLRLNPREVPSPLIGKRAPAFELPLLLAPDKKFSEKDMLGRVWILNVWASWCPPCRQELPLLTSAYATLQEQGLHIVGIDVRDDPGAARDFVPQYEA